MANVFLSESLIEKASSLAVGCCVASGVLTAASPVGGVVAVLAVLSAAGLRHAIKDKPECQVALTKVRKSLGKDFIAAAKVEGEQAEVAAAIAAFDRGLDADDLFTAETLSAALADEARLVPALTGHVLERMAIRDPRFLPGGGVGRQFGEQILDFTFARAIEACAGFRHRAMLTYAEITLAELRESRTDDLSRHAEVMGGLKNLDVAFQRLIRTHLGQRVFEGAGSPADDQTLTVIGEFAAGRISYHEALRRAPHAAGLLADLGELLERSRGDGRRELDALLGTVTHLQRELHLANSDRIGMTHVRRFGRKVTIAAGVAGAVILGLILLSVVDGFRVSQGLKMSAILDESSFSGSQDALVLSGDWRAVEEAGHCLPEMDVTASGGRFCDHFHPASLGTLKTIRSTCAWAKCDAGTRYYLDDVKTNVSALLADRRLASKQAYLAYCLNSLDDPYRARSEIHGLVRIDVADRRTGFAVNTNPCTAEFVIGDAVCTPVPEAAREAVCQRSWLEVQQDMAGLRRLKAVF